MIYSPWGTTTVFLKAENLWPFLLLKTGCIEALGMESGAITDAQLSASSEWGGSYLYAPRQGRLNFQSVSGKKAGAWCPRKNDPDPWLQVDLGSYTTVTRIATQGRNGWGNWWVTKYRILYSDNGITFQYYKEPLDNSAKVNVHAGGVASFSTFCRRGWLSFPHTLKIARMTSLTLPTLWLLKLFSSPQRRINWLQEV